jgi:hypothetical protein
MNTLSEIEAVLSILSTDELVRLEDAVDATLRSRKRLTGAEASRWWEDRDRMSLEEADAFAEDVEAARNEANHPPIEPRWD